MTDIDYLIRETVKKVTFMENKTIQLMKHEIKMRDKTEKAFDKTQDTSFLTFSAVHEGDLKLYSGVKSITLLLQMNLAIMGIINAELTELKKDNPTIRKKMEYKIGKKLSPLIQKFQEQQEVDDDINQKAKDREDKVSDMFG